MAKNFKGKAQKPPLSAVDKVIYGSVVLLLLFVGLFGELYFGFTVPRNAAFADPSVVAGEALNGPFCCLPFLFFCFTMALLVYAFGAAKRQPILGNKAYKAPAFSHTIKTYPLFSQDFRDQLDQKSRDRLRKLAVLLPALLLACLLLLSLGLQSRRVLTDDHKLLTYNAFNRVSDSHDIREAERILISVARSGGRRNSTTYRLQLQFIYENTTYYLYTENFRQTSAEDALRYILELKELLGADNYELQNADRIDRLIHHRHYTEAEAALVYQIFEATP